MKQILAIKKYHCKFMTKLFKLTRTEHLARQAVNKKQKAALINCEYQSCMECNDRVNLCIIKGTRVYTSYLHSMERTLNRRQFKIMTKPNKAAIWSNTAQIETIGLNEVQVKNMISKNSR